MVNESTKQQAALPARCKAAPLYDDEGNIGQHFLLPGLVPDQAAFDRWMAEPQFAEVIAREVEAEKIANGALDALAELAVTPRARDLFLEWLAFVNVDLDPWVTGGAIHFRPHWARVCLLALALGEAEGLNERDLKALCTAAMFHDSRRRDPYLDTGHGGRAAAYYAQFCGDADKRDERESDVGRTIAYDERVYYAIAWHDRDDVDGRKAIEEAGLALPQAGAASGMTIFELFKDADGLDRVRLGSGGLDVSYLRSAHARALVDYAHELNAALVCD